MDNQDRPGPQRSEFVRWARNGVALGIAVVVLVPMLATVFKRPHQDAQPIPAPATQQMGASAQPPLPQLADFRGEDASADARLMANWIVGTHNNRNRAFILVDKKEARVHVFSPEGRLQDSTPVLLGEAQGDTILPGVGDKPLSQIKPEEKTTPAGRFVAEPGMNADNEDVIWVDYNGAISMHRVRPWVEHERRLERLASLSTEDNRISFGCINLPVTFYEDVLRAARSEDGAAGVRRLRRDRPGAGRGGAASRRRPRGRRRKTAHAGLTACGPRAFARERDAKGALRRRVLRRGTRRPIDISQSARAGRP
jgi:hypothetical protein